MAGTTGTSRWLRVVGSLAAALTLASCAAVDVSPEPSGKADQPMKMPDSVVTAPGASQGGLDGPFVVDRVVDGDTVRVLLDGRSQSVRLIGIDTPETLDPRKPVQCFGERASARAHELMDGREVWLEFDPSQGREDRFGRLLAYVWLDHSSMVNETLVREGFAREYTYDDAYKYQETFVADERAAAASGAGLWSPDTCAGDTEQPAN